MTDPVSSAKVVRLGEFEVDLQAGSLSRQGVKIRLREQLFVALSLLVEHAGEVVTREQLQKRLWPGDVLVDFEISLNTIIARLREALGDSAENPRYIETLPKRGYRLLVAVSEADVGAPVPERRVRLVILPFSNAGGDPAEDYFSDAMTDEIITSLCQIAPDRLAVIARSTAMQYKGSHKDVAHIGRELGVDYIVEGAVRRADGQVSMNVQLVRTSDQTHVFAKRYDAAMDDLFDLQNRAAEDVVMHIPSLSEQSRGNAVRKRPSEDVLAYQLYLQGRQHQYNATADGLILAKKYFDEALTRDPKFALAHDALGELYWWTGFFGYMPAKQACFVGLGAVLRAIEIDPALGESHALLGQFRQKVDYNWPEVAREMALALEMAPASPLVKQRYAISYLLPHGRLEEAVAQAKEGLEFDPLNWTLRVWLSIFLWVSRDPDRALREARTSEALDPKNFIPQFAIANAYRGAGHFEEAVAHQSLAVEWSGNAPQMLGWLGLCLARARRTDEARGVLQRLQATAAKTYVSPTSFAWVYAGLGRYDDALVWIDRAIEERDSFIIPIKSYPCLDPLRSDPRFQALVRKMNLEP